MFIKDDEQSAVTSKTILFISDLRLLAAPWDSNGHFVGIRA